jgi:hypothetical protein
MDREALDLHVLDDDRGVLIHRRVADMSTLPMSELIVPPLWSGEFTDADGSRILIFNDHDELVFQLPLGITDDNQRFAEQLLMIYNFNFTERKMQ